MPTWAQGGIDTVRNGGISSDCVRPTHEITVDRHVFRDFCDLGRKVDLVECSIRRGEGDQSLAKALQQDGDGK